VLSNIEPDRFLRLRESMVEDQLRARGIRDERVLDAMKRICRHEFVSQENRAEAYQDHPLPIGYDQTISQPYIVALMLEYLQIAPTDIVLEIGTGSGYQAALLGELAARVYTIERHSALAISAADVLRRLNYVNIVVLTGDGSGGLRERAPFDRIVVSAAAPAIPPALFEQLCDGGRMMIPVGTQYAQELLLVRKEEGRQVITTLEGCRFVPLLPGTPAEEGNLA
jgi:protein-L-isoaspartate(D-aspartate) O-methyltransferase